MTTLFVLEGSLENKITQGDPLLGLQVIRYNLQDLTVGVQFACSTTTGEIRHYKVPIEIKELSV